MEIPRDKVLWHTIDYIRRYHGRYEVMFGTPALFRVARELVEQFKYAERKKGQEWVLGNFDEHIDEYIMEKEEKINVTQNYVLAAEEYDCFGDKFTEH